MTLKLDPKNARKHSDTNKRRIRQSLESVGAGRSILVDAEDIVRAGNGVFAEAQALGIPVKVVESDGKELIAVKRTDLRGKDAIRAASLDNIVGDSSSYQYDEKILREIANDDDLIKALIKEDEKLAALLKGEAKKETHDPAGLVDKAQAFAEKYGTALGQLWQLGEHRLVIGDCTNRSVIDALMAGDKARFEFTDPPYRMDTVGGGVLKDSAQMRSIKDNNLDAFEPLRLSLETQTAVFCCNKPLVKDYILLAEGLQVAWDICFWKKGNTPPNFGGHLMTDTEYLMVLGVQSPNKGQEKELYSKAYIGNADDGKLVAWQKPVGLVHKFIRLYSSPSDIVIDRFCGSGTTIIGCEQLGRKARGAEIKPKYAAVTLERWALLTGQTPQLLGVV